MNQERDQAILMADAMLERVKNASLGEFVEWVTALAICFRRAVVDGQVPEPEVAKIARELVEGIGHASSLEGTEAELEERREQHRRVDAYIAAMKPATIADLMDEMAEGYREVLLHDDVNRLARFHRSLEGDIALAQSELVRDLVRLDTTGGLQFTPVEGDMEALLADCGAAVAT